MKLRLTRAELRSWEAGDVESIVAYANNRQIWLNLRDRFPHPYTKAHAQRFVRASRKSEPECNFAITVDGQAVGGIGFQLHGDVERVSAEIGYWLGEPFWGRGIATEALVALTQYAIATHGLTRVFALPFAFNTALLPRARESRLPPRGPAAAERHQGRQDRRSDAVRVHR